jgi:hypothetical protein
MMPKGLTFCNDVSPSLGLDAGELFVAHRFCSLFDLLLVSSQGIQLFVIV